MKKYTVNYAKNTASIVAFLIVMGGFIVVIPFLLRSQVYRVVTYLMIGGVTVFTLWRLIGEYFCFVEIDEKGIHYYRQGIDAQFSWKEVRRLEYHGNRIIPLTRSMNIHIATGLTLYIDFNIQHYQQAWQEIVSVCKEAYPEVIIDSKFGEKDH